MWFCGQKYVTADNITSTNNNNNNNNNGKSKVRPRTGHAGPEEE